MNVILEPVTDEVIKFDDNNSFNTLIGVENRNLKFISKLYNLKIDSRGNELHFSGLKGSVNLSIKLVKSFYKIIQKGYVPNLSDFELGSKIISNNSHSIEEIFLDTVCSSISSKLPPRCPCLSRSKLSCVVKMPLFLTCCLTLVDVSPI